MLRNLIQLCIIMSSFLRTSLSSSMLYQYHIHKAQVGVLAPIIAMKSAYIGAVSLFNHATVL